MKIQRLKIRGGYRFLRFDGMPNDNLNHLKIPEKVTIPLTIKPGYSATPLVKTGDNVITGQKVAENNNTLPFTLHSTITGVVEEIAKPIQESKNPLEITGYIKIKNNGKPEEFSAISSSENWDTMDTEGLIDLIYQSGATVLGRSGIPLDIKSKSIKHKIEHIIIDASESDVYTPSTGFLLKENITPLISGIGILKRVFPETRIFLVINKKRKSIINTIKSLSRESYNNPIYKNKLNDQIDVIFLTNGEYPVNSSQLIIKLTTGKDLPLNTPEYNVGVLIFDVLDILNLFNTISNKTPLIETIILAAGPGFKKPSYIKTRVGTPVETIVANIIDNSIKSLDNEDSKNPDEIRFFENSLINGTEIKNLKIPVTSNTRSIIAVPKGDKGEFLSFALPGFKKDSFSKTYIANFLPFKKGINTNLHGERRPCISCGFCRSVCPVDIYPHILYQFIERNIIEDTVVRYGIFECIECKLCSYVCPSKIEIAKFLTLGKEKLEEMGIHYNDYVKNNLKIDIK